jgi:hypothetical protein
METPAGIAVATGLAAIEAVEKLLRAATAERSYPADALLDVAENARHRAGEAERAAGIETLPPEARRQLRSIADRLTQQAVRAEQLAKWLPDPNPEEPA